MKRSICLLCLMALALFSACAKKMTVDDVVAKMTQSLGGAEKLAGIQDQVSTWDMMMNVPMGDSIATMNGTMAITYKTPNKIKFEIMGPDGATMLAGVFNGTTGWQMMMGQVREMTQAEVQEHTTLAETWISGYHDYAKKGMNLMLMADTTLEGKSYHVLKATDRFGNSSMNYCNTQTGLCERMDGEGTDGMTLEKKANTMTFSDYAAFDGLMMAKKVLNHDSKGALLFEATLKEAKHNSGVSDEAFVTPAPTAPPAETTAK
jgi:outer membrane lipoprotein-sorting protein